MKRDLKTVSAFAESGPFTEAQLRWYIFNEANNGMRDHSVIVRVGRRVYIDENSFDRWIDSQQVAA